MYCTPNASLLITLEQRNIKQETCYSWYFLLAKLNGNNHFQNICQKCQYCDVIISPGSNIYPKWANANNFETNKYENLKLGILDYFRTLNWMETTIFQNIHKKWQYCDVTIIPRGPIYTPKYQNLRVGILPIFRMLNLMYSRLPIIVRGYNSTGSKLLFSWGKWRKW